MLETQETTNCVPIIAQKRGWGGENMDTGQRLEGWISGKVKKKMELMEFLVHPD